MKRLLLRAIPVVLVPLCCVACRANSAVDSGPASITATSVATTPALAAYEPTAMPTTAPSATPTAVPSTTPTAAPRATLAIRPDGCPEPTDDTRLLINRPGGYCLLYPDTHTAVRGGFDGPEPAGVRIVQGSILGGGPQATIIVGQATGEDLKEAAQIAQEKNRAGTGLEVGLVELEVAGQPAYMLVGLGGQDLSRSLVFELDDWRYNFTFRPDEVAGSEVAASLTQFADVILNSFTPIPVNEATTAEDECLEPRADERLIVSEPLGFCLLLPETYTQEDAGDGSTNFQSGSGVDADHPQLTVVVTDAGSQTAQMLTDHLIREKNELTGQPSMVTMFTVGDGNILATMVDGAPGHETERLLLFDHDDRRYQLAFTPYDPAQPELTGAMAELVTLVTQSFRFLR